MTAFDIYVTLLWDEVVLLRNPWNHFSPKGEKTLSLYREARRRIRPPEQEESTRTQERFLALLRRSAGVDYAPGRDPVYALSEGFSQVFDWVGMQSARLRMGKAADPAAGTSMRPLVEDDAQGALRRFASYAFQSGRMAGAVLRGQGEMMLHACLRRAAGRGLPQTEVRRRLDSLADERPVPQSAARVRFGEDEHSAIAVTLRATTAATRALAAVQKSAKTLEGQGVSTMREAFPFLFTQEDRALIAALSEKRRNMGQASREEVRAVDRALVRARAVLQKKEQRRGDFLTKLESMLANARAAERLFAQMEAESLQNWRKPLTETRIPPDSEGEDVENVGAKAGKAASRGE